MDEVGRLFNDNQLIVAEVLQSAEAMKTAVAHLEPYLENAGSATRATIILATVKGDVHDIGKNLVEIIFANNGYRIVNLGIKVPPEELIAACHTHHPDAIGLSFVLSRNINKRFQELSQIRGIPIFVGGRSILNYQGLASRSRLPPGRRNRWW